MVLATPPFWLARAMIGALRVRAMGRCLSVGARGRADSLTRAPGARASRTNRRKACADGSSGRPSTQASPTSRYAPSSVSGSSRVRAKAVGTGSPWAGTTETPTPAATKPRMVGRSSASMATSGSKPAARHSSRVCRRIPEGGARRTNGWSATSASDTDARPASGWPSADGEDERLVEHVLPGDALAGDPGGRQLEVGPPGGELGRDPAVLPRRRALEGDAHPRVLAPEGADEVGDEPAAEAQREGEGDHAALGVDELTDRGQPVVEGVDEAVDVLLERDAGVGHPQHPALPVQQRGADLALQPGQGARDARAG